MQEKIFFNLAFWALLAGTVGFLASIFAIWQNQKLGRVYRAFFMGGQSLNMESILLHLNQMLAEQQGRQDHFERELTKLKEITRGAVQKVGLVRFNPFADSGGNLSFCLALLDDRLNGIVVTSIHGRQQNRIYAKNIVGGKNSGGLTEEEMEALNLAVT